MRSVRRAWKQDVGRPIQQWDTAWVAGPVCCHCYQPIHKRSQATRLFAYPDLVPDECTGDRRVLGAWIHRRCAGRERR